MMTRNNSLKQIAASTSHSLRGLTAGEALERPVAKGLDRKDRLFFERHAAEPAKAVAQACMDGRVWPGDDSLSAQRLRTPAARTR